MNKWPLQLLSIIYLIIDSIKHGFNGTHTQRCELPWAEPFLHTRTKNIHSHKPKIKYTSFECASLCDLIRNPIHGCFHTVKSTRWGKKTVCFWECTFENISLSVYRSLFSQAASIPTKLEHRPKVNGKVKLERLKSFELVDFIFKGPMNTAVEWPLSFFFFFSFHFKQNVDATLIFIVRISFNLIHVIHVNLHNILIIKTW